MFYYNSILIHQKICNENNNVTPEICYTNPELTLQILAYIVVAGLLGYILVLILLRKRLNFTNGIFEITSEPMKKIKSIFFIPIMQIILGLLIVIGCFYIVLWTLSIGSIVTVENNNVPGGYVNTLIFQNSDKAILAFIILMSL